MFQHYIAQFPSYFNSPRNQDWVQEKFNRILSEQQRKFIAKNLNPFNSCPGSVTFWFPIIQYVYIGVTVSSFKKILIVIRQQIEPNEIISLNMTILRFQLPYPLTLLMIFSSLGLWVNGAVNKIIENAITQLMNDQEKHLSNLEERIDSLCQDIPLDDPSLLPPDVQEKAVEALAEENNRRIRQALNPFNLNPRMTVSLPIFGAHTRINLGFTDFQRIAISIKQFLEPQDVIYTLIRFIELKVPFPLTILALFLSIGLFINGSVNEFEQGTRNGIMNEVKRIFQEEYRK